MQVLPEHQAGEVDKVDDDAEVNDPLHDNSEALHAAAAVGDCGSDLREPLLGGDDVERVRASLVVLGRRWGRAVLERGSHWC